MKKLFSFMLATLLFLSILTPMTNANQMKDSENAPKLLLQSGTVDLKSIGVGKNPENKLYVVQFRDVIQEEAHELLHSVGAEVKGYIPDFAFVIKMDAVHKETLASDPLVYGVIPFQNDWKLAKSLSAIKGDKDKEVVVTVLKGQEKETEKYLTQLGGKVKHVGNKAVTAALKPDLIKKLTENPDISYIEEDFPKQLTNDKAAIITQVSTPTGEWNNSLTGEGQVVGMMDSGLDTGDVNTLHLDLRNRLIAAMTVEGSQSRANNTWADTGGHGTHVAGSIVGNGTLSGGLTKGMAPAAKLVLQAASGGCDGCLTFGDLYTIFSEAQQAGAKIHSNSWQADNNDYGYITRTADQYAYDHKDFTLLFSAGNLGANGYNTVRGVGKNIITVGATENARPDMGSWSDSPNQIAAFSGLSYAFDNRIKPDVVAPGTNILSTRSSLTNELNIGPGYTYKSGTSMSTPVTSGITALIRQYYMDFVGNAPSSALLKASLINGADDVGYGWMSRETGWGRVNVENATFPSNNRKNEFVDNSNGLTTSNETSYPYTVEAGQIFKTTLVWTDYPGAEYASKAMVNDLDLEVTAPDGRIYKGNCFVSNTASTSCTSFDRTNNVENVYINAPVAGTYMVKIKGYNVPIGSQPFALVVSGKNVAIGNQLPPVPVTINPDDAYVRAGSYAGTNYGNTSALYVKTDSATVGNNRLAYLKFNLSGVSSVSSAKLRVYGSASATTTLTAYQTTDNWTEATITWNNKPALGAVNNSVTMGTTAQYYEIDVTPYVQAQVSGDKIVSFVLKESSGKYTTLKSAENSSNKPQLVIN